MRRLPLPPSSLALLLLSACATLPPPKPAPARPPGADAVAASLRDAIEGFRANDAGRMEHAFAAARSSAAADVTLGNQVALTEAAVHAEREDLEGAARLLLDRIAVAQRARHPSELDLHDRMIFVCEARGDRLCALLEALEMRTVIERRPPPWPAQVRQGYYWQRAHTLRQLAQTLTGDDRAAAILYARQARNEFADLARTSGHSLQSIAVLDEEFAALDADCPTALSLARSLPPEQLDPQDLYTTSFVLETCGDHPGAAALRARIEAGTDFDLFDAVYRLMARRADGARP